MFALECASLLSCRLNLLHRPLGDGDRQPLSQALQSSPRRCPETVRSAVPEAVEQLFDQARGRRIDQLLGIWVIAAEEAGRGSDPQTLWLAQVVRRLLPRSAIQALLGFDREEILNLIGSKPVVAEERRQRSLGFCDNHLHSGAADEFGDLLARLIPRVAEISEPRDLKEAVGSDAAGPDLNAGPLVLALAAACTLLGCPDDPSGDDEQRLADPRWWEIACDLAHAAGRIDPVEFTELRRTMQVVALQQGGAPQLSTLYKALRKVAAGSPLSAPKLEATRRGLVALVALHGLIVVPPGSSLGTFVPRFELMRKIRGLFGEDRGRLESALRTMFLHSGVTGMELRKSVRVVSARTVSVDRIAHAIQADMKEHALAAIRASENLKTDELVVRMPLTFTRRDPEPLEPGIEPLEFVAFRAPVGETMALADAIVQATQQESCARFVGAVDIVGNEKKVPNWLYALAYKRIAAAEPSRLEFACHAGEYFADHLEGLRRVAEVALFHPADVTRIGHCLSVGVSEGTDRESSPTALVLLENVIWAMLLLDDRRELGLGNAGDLAVPAELQRDLKRVALQLTPYVFETDALAVTDLCQWYLKRFDPSAMARWLPEPNKLPPTETIDWPRGTSLLVLPRPSGLLDAMLATTLYEKPFEVDTPFGFQQVTFESAAELPAALRARASALVGQVEPFAHDAVHGWLATEKIVIESCPSSNAALLNIEIGSHPIWAFHNRKLTCSVNTDDPALFGAAVNEEYIHAGMVADENGGQGASFVRELAEASRTIGTIQSPLCDSTEKPLDAYRAVLDSMGFHP